MYHTHFALDIWLAYKCALPPICHVLFMCCVYWMVLNQSKGDDIFDEPDTQKRHDIAHACQRFAICRIVYCAGCCKLKIHFRIGGNEIQH